MSKSLLAELCKLMGQPINLAAPSVHDGKEYDAALIVGVTKLPAGTVHLLRRGKVVAELSVVFQLTPRGLAWHLPKHNPELN